MRLAEPSHMTRTVSSEVVLHAATVGAAGGLFERLAEETDGENNQSPSAFTLFGSHFTT